MIYRNQVEQHIDAFPEMPPLCRKLIGCMDDPDVDFTTIKDILQYDPGLTANVLRLANSVYFGAVQEVNSLHAALVRLGTDRIMELVLSLSVSPKLLHTLPGYGLPAGDLLKHSIWTAVAAQELAVLLEMENVETVFTVGLLHDLGLLILDPFLQEQEERFRRRIEDRDTSFERIEKEIVGIDHAEAGAKLLSRWNLGPEIVSGVRWHHEPEQATGHKELIFLVHLADMLALSEGIGTGIHGLQYTVSPASIKSVGLRKHHLEYAASKTLDRVRELERILS